MPVKVKATVAGALNGLPQPATAKWPLGVWDTEVLAHGSMSVSLFAPKETDFQAPHDQDELYIIVAGSGEFVCDGQTYKAFHNFIPSQPQVEARPAVVSG